MAKAKKAPTQGTSPPQSAIVVAPKDSPFTARVVRNTKTEEVVARIRRHTTEYTQRQIAAVASVGNHADQCLRAFDAVMSQAVQG